MRACVLPAIILAVSAFLTGSGTATAATPDRSWTATQFRPGGGVGPGAITSTAPGETIALYLIPPSGSSESELKAWTTAGGAGGDQTLGTDVSNFAMDGSAHGGAVAAWSRDDLDQIQIAQFDAAAGKFDAPLSSPGYSAWHSEPIARVNDEGDALVVYMASAGARRSQVLARYRPAGGAFGPPQDVSGAAEGDRIAVRDAALGPDGRAAVALVDEGRAKVAIRPAGDAAFGEAELVTAAPIEPPPTGVNTPELRLPRIGMDAAGDVAVAWLQYPGEAGPEEQYPPRPVKIAFKRPGQPFATPIDTGLRATSLQNVDLQVSDPGEVLLAAETTSSSPYGDALDGIHGVFGDVTRQTMGEPGLIANPGAWHSVLAMNSRGDAVVLWDACCPLVLRARRRGPGASFGHPVEVQPPIDVQTSRRGRSAYLATMDQPGNAQAAWVDMEPPAQYFVGFDRPLIRAQPPPPGPLTGSIPRVNSPGEEPSGHVEQQVPLGAPSGPMTAPGGFANGDRRGPRVRLRTGGQALALRRRRVAVTVRCSEACKARVSGSLAGVRLRPVRVRVKGHRRTVALRWSKKKSGRIRRAARRSRRGLKLKVTAVARDPSGNVSRTTLRRRVR